MILWTIQTLDAHRELQVRGSLRGNSESIDPVFREPYEWMIEQLTRRIGPPDLAGAWPVWAWKQYHGQTKPRPNLRSKGLLPKGSTGVRIELDVPDEKVLLFDFLLWHFILNDRYLSTSNDGETFDHRLIRIGQSFCHTKPLTDPDLLRKVTDSWERVFDLGWNEKDITGPLENRGIQATLWRIDSSMVRTVTEFTAN